MAACAALSEVEEDIYIPKMEQLIIVTTLLSKTELEPGKHALTSYINIVLFFLTLTISVILFYNLNYCLDNLRFMC